MNADVDRQALDSMCRSPALLSQQRATVGFRRCIGHRRGLRVLSRAVRTATTLLAMLMLAPVARADYYIVVSERNPVTAMSQKEALQIFMGRSRNFPDGRPAIACDIGNDVLRAGFYRLLGGMSLPQVNSYWARLMFSGRSLPPQRLENESAMVERIANDPSAIGWLPQAPKQKGLRTVLILPGAP